MNGVVKAIIKYAAAGAVAAVVVVLMLWGRGYFGMTAWQERCKLLCDAFTVAGLLLILFSTLVWVSTRGAFLGIGYALGWLVHTLLPFRQKKHETYREYRDRKLEKGGVHGYSFLFFTGLAYFAVALILLIVYYRIPTA